MIEAVPLEEQMPRTQSIEPNPSQGDWKNELRELIEQTCDELDCKDEVRRVFRQSRSKLPKSRTARDKIGSP